MKPIDDNGPGVKSNRASLTDVSVVISTRNRPEDIANALPTVLKCAPGTEVIVVDQSDNDLTNIALQPFLKHKNLQYYKSTSRGLSAGRNEGIRLAKSEFIAMTDDDCKPCEGWPENLLPGFSIDERVGLVFGNVKAGSYSKENGFIPSYERTSPYLAWGIANAHRVDGMGANFCVRKSAWRELGGFDESFGAGGRFISAEELDLKLRALASGHGVYETPNSFVIHNGYRTWEEGKGLIRGYLYGIGATAAKQLRLGHWNIIVLLLHLMIRWAFGAPVIDLGQRKPSRRLRILGFLHGFFDGVFYPIDRRRGHFDTGRKADAALKHHGVNHNRHNPQSSD